MSREEVLNYLEEKREVVETKMETSDKTEKEIAAELLAASKVHDAGGTDVRMSSVTPQGVYSEQEDGK